jgi:periplasmic protein TonB
MDTMRRLSFTQRPVVIAVAVLSLHLGGLMALQSGLLVRTDELVIPVEMISQIITPPKPIQLEAPLPPPPSQPPPPARAPKPPETTKQSKSVNLPPAPQPSASADAAPASNALVVTAAAPPAPLPPITTPVAPAPTAAPAPAQPATPAPKVELPRADADYLNNPRPPYPLLSKRRGEQGRVMVRVYVGEDGLPQKSELRTSSGHERLDATAVATVMGWRFRPGMRGGAPEAMWVNVPIDFDLNN